MFANKQRGLTIVELAIAMFISSIVIYAIVEVFISARGVYVEQTKRLRIQENTRFAAFFPVYIARIGGYYQIAGNNVRNDPETVITGVDAASGSVTITLPGITETVSDVMNGTDVLAISYQGHVDGAVQNCQSQTILANQLALDVFYVKSNGSIACNPKVVSLNGGVGSDSFAQPLTSGVAGFEVLYGVDRTEDSSVNRYIPISDFDSANIEFSDIVALRIKLCVTAEEDDLSLAMAQCGSPSSNPDRWLVQTISLRNLQP